VHCPLAPAPLPPSVAGLGAANAAGVALIASAPTARRPAMVYASSSWLVASLVAGTALACAASGTVGLWTLALLALSAAVTRTLVLVGRCVRNSGPPVGRDRQQRGHALAGLAHYVLLTQALRGSVLKVPPPRGRGRPKSATVGERLAPARLRSRARGDGVAVRGRALRVGHAVCCDGHRSGDGHNCEYREACDGLAPHEVLPSS